MIILLNKSKLFTTEPSIRFAKEYKVSRKVWDEVWKRHTLHGFDLDSLTGYVVLKTNINKKNAKEIVQRWIALTEIYCIANHVKSLGVRAVQSEYFGGFEDIVINLATKSIKFNKVNNSCILA